MATKITFEGERPGNLSQLIGGARPPLYDYDDPDWVPTEPVPDYDL